MPSTSPEQAHGVRWGALLRGRCPRCGQGAMFRGQITMNTACAECSLRFDREEGYYSGAMYASYFLSIGVLTVIGIVVWLLLGAYWSLNPLMLLSAVLFLLTVPTIFRYSRVIWLHIDWAINRDRPGTHNT